MLSYFNWLTIHNNWVLGLVWILMFVFFMCHDMKGERIKFAAFGLVMALIPAGLSTWSGYHQYKNHYTTCSKPAAVSAMYVFDFDREVCLRPFVGFVPVDQEGNVETSLPKPKVLKEQPQLALNIEGENNV